jgi:hypothetical protein
MRIRSRFAAAASAALLACCVTGSVLAQSAQPNTPTQVPQPESGVNWPGAGYGAAALLGNVVYIPAKLVYAVLGGLIGGGTWLVTAGNTQAADTVWRSSLGGDYVLTPQMIAGEQPINFSGPTETPPVTADASGSSAVRPIAPLPPAPSSAATASNGGARPLDSGAGPVNSRAATDSSIE